MPVPFCAYSTALPHQQEVTMSDDFGTDYRRKHFRDPGGKSALRAATLRVVRED